MVTLPETNSSNHLKHTLIPVWGLFRLSKLMIFTLAEAVYVQEIQSREKEPWVV